MNGVRCVAVFCALCWVLVSSGCAASGEPSREVPEIVTTETPQADSSEDVVTAGEVLNALAGTQWTGRDDYFREQVTFILAADGTVSYRNATGEFSYEGDTWVVEGDVLTFQADYRGPFGVATHTARYDPAVGALQVEYTTTTDRAGTYTLYLLD